MNDNVAKQVNDFLTKEKQFHLGFLPTEQSNPKTKDLEARFAKSAEDGVALLLSVDRDIAPVARRVFSSPQYAALEKAVETSLSTGHRVVFSGCGATGRLSILLETMWRRGLADLNESNPETGAKAAKYADSVFSIMTGGDFALVKAVESFEDYNQFGRRQARDMGLGKGDTLVGITEGGETSSVIGTVEEAVELGASAFMLFNNPEDILSAHLERCRRVLSNPGVVALDLHCGPMAVAGSTRMQATTIEQLVAGAALENALRKLAGLGDSTADWAARFEKMLDCLCASAAVKALAGHIRFEAEIYRRKGLVTYYADRALLDIFTDTTERSPTFMLPTFRAVDDTVSPPPWAFVKHPFLPTKTAWEAALAREPRGLDWTAEDYVRMDAPEKIRTNPPKLDAGRVLKFQIGSERDGSRFASEANAAILMLFGSELQRMGFGALASAFELKAADYAERRVLVVGGDEKVPEDVNHVPCTVAKSPLRLLEHLAMKLALNTISTGTMVVLGRVSGNWMTHVSVSNKKLIDRSIRLVSELCGIDYETACAEIFEAIDDLERNTAPSEERVSPVQHVLKKRMANRPGC